MSLSSAPRTAAGPRPQRGGPAAVRAAALVAAVAAVACSAPPPATAPSPATAAATAATPATAPPPAAAAPTPASPAAQLPDGARLQLELAVTPEEITNGLMFRPSLRPDHGMLFLFDQRRVPSFWMKNTRVPLDMVFLAGDGTVVDVIRDVQPCAGDPCPQYVPRQAVWAVLEIAAGVADRHQVAEGARLDFRHVPGYPRPATEP